jgi:hypothetical protein
MRRLVTWLIVGFLGAVVVAATTATLVRDDSDSAARGDTSPSRPGVARCRPAQLSLSVETRSDRPVIVLRQVSGPPCDVGTLQITTKVRDQRGEAVLVQDFRSAFTGEISPAVDFISGFVYTPLCNQRGPLVATVTAGKFTASQTLPVRNCLSPTPTSGERESPSRCDAQQLALTIKRPRLSSSVAVVQLRHVRGRACVVGTRINLRVFAVDGERVALLSFDGSGRFRGEMEPGTSLLAGFSFLPWCGQRGPFLAVVTAGSHKARRTLPHPRACETQ